MKEVLRLTENDLIKVIKKLLKEESTPPNTQYYTFNGVEYKRINSIEWFYWNPEHKEWRDLYYGASVNGNLVYDRFTLEKMWMEKSPNLKSSTREKAEKTEFKQTLSQFAQTYQLPKSKEIKPTKKLTTPMDVALGNITVQDFQINFKQPLFGPNGCPLGYDVVSEQEVNSYKDALVKPWNDTRYVHPLYKKGNNNQICRRVVPELELRDFPELTFASVIEAIRDFANGVEGAVTLTILNLVGLGQEITEVLYGILALYDSVNKDWLNLIIDVINIVTAGRFISTLGPISKGIGKVSSVAESATKLKSLPQFNSIISTVIENQKSLTPFLKQSASWIDNFLGSQFATKLVDPIIKFFNEFIKNYASGEIKTFAGKTIYNMATNESIKKITRQLLKEQTEPSWKACKNMFDQGAVRLVGDKPFPPNMFKVKQLIQIKGYTKNPGSSVINGGTRVLAVDPNRKWIKIDKSWPKGKVGIQDECATVSTVSFGGRKNCAVDPANLKRCENAWNKQLANAVKFWKDWLNHPETKKKVIKNWDVYFGTGAIQLAIYYPLYMKHLNSIRLKFYNCSMTSFKNKENTYAFVRRNENTTIYINCSKKPESLYNTLIHEIQHMIYNIKPLNPEKKMENLFVAPGTRVDTDRSIMAGLLSTKAKKVGHSQPFSPLVIKTAKQLGVSPADINMWERERKMEEAGGQKRYICEHTEKLSNIMAMRQLFKVQPGQNITLKMLIPYIKHEKKEGNISWYLLCWAQKGFPDLTQVLNRTNELAKQSNDQQQQNNVNYIGRDPES